VRLHDSLIEVTSCYVDDEMGTIDVTRFAKAITAARKRLDQTQAVFGRRFEVGRQSIARWEAGIAFPSDMTRAVIFDSVGDLPPDVRLEIAIALGADPPAPPPAPQVAVAPPVVDRRAVMEGIVFRAAEELDLGPRGVRAAIANALAEMERRGVGVRDGYEELRGRMAERKE
jgi:hypothetical protein